MRSIETEVGAVRFRVNVLGTPCASGSARNVAYTHSLFELAGVRGISPASQMGAPRLGSLPQVTKVLKGEAHASAFLKTPIGDPRAARA